VPCSKHSPAVRKPASGPALDLALGFVAFAREEPRLFRFVVDGLGNADVNVTAAATDPLFVSGFGPSSPIAEVFRRLSGAGQRQDFVLRTWIFTYGLAELVSTGHVAMDDAEVARHLGAAGGAFYQYELQKSGRPDGEPNKEIR
jgi:hypothetical protein